MKEINEVITESIQNYFYQLAIGGYKKNSSVNKLLVLQFIGELLQGDLRFYINKEDHRAIQKALYCIYGSDCMIPFPQYEIDQSMVAGGDQSVLQARLSELSDYRSSTGYPVRISKQ